MLSVLRLSPMAAALAGIYGVVSAVDQVNSFFNEHIERLKASWRALNSASAWGTRAR